MVQLLPFAAVGPAFSCNCCPLLRLGPLLAVEVAEGLVKALRTRRRDVFVRQSALLVIEAPIKICFDILDQYHDLLCLFEYGRFSPESILLSDAAVHSGRVGTHSRNLLPSLQDSFTTGVTGHRPLGLLRLQSAHKAKYPENFFLCFGAITCVHRSCTSTCAS